MKLAGDFLSKFKSLTPPDDAIKRAVAEAVHNVVGIPAKKKDVTLANGIAFIDCSSVAKSALRTRRSEILKELFEALPKAREEVRDIR